MQVCIKAEKILCVLKVLSGTLPEALYKKKVFRAPALWVDAFYMSICPYVCVSVCSLLRYSLNVFLPPLPKVGCPKLLEIWNPWGKVMERSGLRFKHFY